VLQALCNLPAVQAVSAGSMAMEPAAAVIATGSKCALDGERCMRYMQSPPRRRPGELLPAWQACPASARA